MKITFKLLAASILLAAGVAQASSVTLVNGGFESPEIPTNTALQIYPGSADALAFGWTIATGGVELRDSRNFPAGYTHIAKEGSQYIELAVEGQNSSISQIVNLKAGQEYTLKFAFSPRAPYNAAANQATASFAGKELDLGAILGLLANATTQGPSAAIDLWQYATITVVGRGLGETIMFTATGNNQSFGMFFDDVSLTATPLPGAALLFGTSLAGFLAARKRRKAAALAA